MKTIGSAASVTSMNKVTVITEPTIAYKAFIAVSKPTMFRAVSDFSKPHEGAEHADVIQPKTEEYVNLSQKTSNVLL